MEARLRNGALGAAVGAAWGRPCRLFGKIGLCFSRVRILLSPCWKLCSWSRSQWGGHSVDIPDRELLRMGGSCRLQPGWLRANQEDPQVLGSPPTLSQRRLHVGPSDVSRASDCHPAHPLIPRTASDREAPCDVSAGPTGRAPFRHARPSACLSGVRSSFLSGSSALGCGPARSTPLPQLAPCVADPQGCLSGRAPPPVARAWTSRCCLGVSLWASQRDLKLSASSTEPVGFPTPSASPRRTLGAQVSPFTLSPVAGSPPT